MLPDFWPLSKFFGQSDSPREQDFRLSSLLDPFEERFNYARSSPAPASSRLRTGSRLDHRFSMRPQHEPPHRGERLSVEELATYFPGYRNDPPDAVGIPIPGNGTPNGSMARSTKPGARSAMVPRNTLSQASPHAARTYEPARLSIEKYDAKATQSRGLPVEASRGENVRVRSFVADDANTGPSKRRKLSLPSSPRKTFVDLTDEDHPAVKTSPARRASSGHDSMNRDHFRKFTAPGSNGSAQSALSGAFGLDSFKSVEDRMNPKHYVGSQGSQNGLCQGQASAAGSTKESPRDRRGHSAQPIEVSDDEVPRQGYVMNALLKSIPGLAKPKTVKGRPFGQQLPQSPKYSASHDDELARDQLGGTSPTHGLPSGSHRESGRGQNGFAGVHRSGPVSTQHKKTKPRPANTINDDSEDELQLAVPKALPEVKQRESTIRKLEDYERGQTKSRYFKDNMASAKRTSKPRRSSSPEVGASKADIKPSVFTSSKGNKATKLSTRSHRKVGLDSARWSLKSFKIPGSPEITEPNMVLIAGHDKPQWMVYGKDGFMPMGNGLYASIDLSKANKAVLGTAGSCKVLFTGVREEVAIYRRYVEFNEARDIEELRDFLSKKAFPVQDKSPHEMDQLFARADEYAPRNPRPEVVDAGDEVAFLESRDNRHRQEAVQRSGDKERAYNKEATSAIIAGRSRHKTKLVSQLQTELARTEDSTRTSRVSKPTESVEMADSQAPTNARSTRSKIRNDSGDLQIEFESVRNYVDPDDPWEEEQWPQIEHPKIPWKHPLVYPPTGRQRAQVEWADLYKLFDGEFLNDSIIAFYMTWASKRAEQCGTLPPNKVYWFNTYFYSTLTKTARGQKGVNYEGVQRWTSRVDIFTYDYVVIPINEDQHWYLAIVCNLPALARKIESGNGIEEKSKIPAKDLPKDELAAQVHELLQGKSDPTSETTKETEDAGDPMEIEAHNQLLQGMEEGVGDKRPEEQPKSFVHEELQRLSTPQPRNDGARHSPISVDDDKVEPKLLPNSQEDISKTSPGGKKGRKKQAPPPKKFDADQPVIIMLDSLGLPHSKTTRNLKEYLVMEGKSKRGLEIDVKAFHGMTAKEIPTQDNYCDCGIFVCLYFEKFINDPDQFVHKILRREMDVQKDWPDLSPPQTRRDILALLTDLYEEQSRERREQRRKNKEQKKKKEEDDKTKTEDPGSSSVSKQSSPMKTSPEAVPERAAERGSESRDESRPEGSEDTYPSTNLSRMASPEIKQETSPPPLPPRVRGPQVIVDAPQNLDPDLPHPRRSHDREASPQVRVVSKPDPHTSQSSPTLRKRKESPVNHGGQDDSIMEVEPEQFEQASERAQGVEQEAMEDYDHDQMVFDYQVEEHEIPDSQSQPELEFEKKARKAHKEWKSKTDAEIAAGGSDGNTGVKEKYEQHGQHDHRQQQTAAKKDDRKEEHQEQPVTSSSPKRRKKREDGQEELPTLSSPKRHKKKDEEQQERPTSSSSPKRYTKKKTKRPEVIELDDSQP